MKVELHLHTSRYSPCAADPPNVVIEALIKAGYGAVFITEHERMWTHSELRMLQKDYPQIQIHPGVELAIGNGATHMLVLGTTDLEYIWLQSEPAAVLEKARAEGHLTVLCHPFRWTEKAEMLEAGLLPDAIEHRTNNHFGEMAKKSRRAAKKYKIRPVNSGDIHSAHSVGHFWIETQFPLEMATDIRPIILGGRYQLGDNVEKKPKKKKKAEAKQAETK